MLAESFTFHDLRAKSGSDAESVQEANDRLAHDDLRTRRRWYIGASHAAPALVAKLAHSPPAAECLGAKMARIAGNSSRDTSRVCGT